MRRVSRVTTAILATVMTSGSLWLLCPRRRRPRPRPKRRRSPRCAPKPASFNLASFNVLGASHTLNGARGMASGAVRIVRANQLLERHHVDVAGFQEMQASQLTSSCP